MFSLIIRCVMLCMVKPCKKILFYHKLEQHILCATTGYNKQSATTGNDQLIGSDHVICQLILNIIPHFLLIPIDLCEFQLTLLNPHDSLLVKWIVKTFLNFCQKTFQFTFRLQNTLLNCTWSGPKSVFFFALSNLLGIFHIKYFQNKKSLVQLIF